MNGYSSRHIFSKRAVLDMHQAQDLVLNIHDRTEDTIRCHELVRIVEPFLLDEWNIADGKYGAVDHSWLYRVDVVNRNVRIIILDVYSVGRLPMVQLVDKGWQLPQPHKDIYVQDSFMSDVREGVILTHQTHLSECGFIRREKKK